jgi:hypothetical protein
MNKDYCATLAFLALGLLVSPGNPVTPISPPSGTAQRLFQEPTAKSNFLAV